MGRYFSFALLDAEGKVVLRENAPIGWVANWRVSDGQEPLRVTAVTVTIEGNEPLEQSEREELVRLRQEITELRDTLRSAVRPLIDAAGLRAIDPDADTFDEGEW